MSTISPASGTTTTTNAFTFTPDSLVAAAKDGDLRLLKTALDSGVPIDAPNSRGERALEVAIYQKNEMCIDELFRRGASIDHIPHHLLDTALDYAVKLEYPHIVTALLSDRVKNSAIPLLVAIETGNLDIVKIIIAGGADVNKEDARGVTPLMHAVKKGNLPLIEILVKAKADPNKGDKHGKTPLMMSAANDNQADITAFLLASGAKIDQVDESKESALIYAAKKGNIDCLRVLLENKADFRLCNDFGATPLMITAKYGKIDCLKALLDAGADIEAVDHHQNTAIIIAAKKTDYDCVTLLVQKRANIHARNNEKRSALSYLLGYAFMDYSGGTLVENLVTPGDITQLTDLEKEQLLFITIHQQNIGLMRVLLLEGDRICLDQALHSAVRSGFTEGVETLLNRGANYNFADGYDQTPLMLAIAESQTGPILELLIERGATLRPPHTLTEFATEQGVPHLIPVVETMMHKVAMKKAASSGNLAYLTERLQPADPILELLILAAQNNQPACVTYLLEELFRRSGIILTKENPSESAFQLALYYENKELELLFTALSTITEQDASITEALEFLRLSCHHRSFIDRLEKAPALFYDQNGEFADAFSCMISLTVPLNNPVCDPNNKRTVYERSYILEWLRRTGNPNKSPIPGAPPLKVEDLIPLPALKGYFDGVRVALWEALPEEVKNDPEAISSCDLKLALLPAEIGPLKSAALAEIAGLREVAEAELAASRAQESTK